MQEIGVQALGLEDPLEEEMATPLWYSCLENPTDRGARRATVRGVTKESDMTEPLRMNLCTARVREHEKQYADSHSSQATADFLSYVQTPQT